MCRFSRTHRETETVFSYHAQVQRRAAGQKCAKLFTVCAKLRFESFLLTTLNLTDVLHAMNHVTFVLKWNIFPRCSQESMLSNSF